ncbi:sulfotransferase family protein [Luteibaculum oceani]|uniref:sulfotransferase family protein n=1 Tax=Luteibaculum oceani TaxID=1294296 RepID=UPI0014770E5A|nr:sulfotransferase [Luteibaculum oceani]
MDLILSLILGIFNRKPEPCIEDNSQSPVVFIIGLPRSGTTILYQKISEYYNVIYTSNFWSLFPFSGKYFKRLITLTPPKNDVKSFYGNSRHLNGVQEGGAILKRWFGNSHFLANISDQKMVSFRKEIEWLHNNFKLPVLIKNTRNCLKIKLLYKIFPQAKFIIVDRDKLDIAYSLYRGRLDFGGIDKNFTTSPPELAQYQNRDPYFQIAAQVFYLKKHMEQQLKQIPEKNFIRVHYSQLKENPHETLRNINTFFDFELRDNKGKKFSSAPLQAKKRKQKPDIIYKFQTAFQELYDTQGED